MFAHSPGVDTVSPGPGQAVYSISLGQVHPGSPGSVLSSPPGDSQQLIHSRHWHGAGACQDPGPHPSALGHPVSCVLGTVELRGAWCWDQMSSSGPWGPSWLSGVGLLRAVEDGGATPHFGDHCCSEKGDHGHQVMPSQLLLRTLGIMLPGLHLLDMGISSPAGLCPGLCLTAEPRARAASAAGQTRPWHSLSSGKLHQRLFQRRLSFSPEQPRATVPPGECGRGQQSPVGPSRGSLVWTAAYTCGHAHVWVLWPPGRR